MKTAVKIAIIGAIAEAQFSGEVYEEHTAQEKFNMIDQAIRNGDDNVASHKYERLGRFFRQSQGRSIAHVGDDMPRDEEFGTRIKFVHQQGLVAPIRWVEEPGQPYSGLFKGGDLGFARISESGFMMAGDTSSNPSAAIKMFRDGIPSGNLLFMESFDGQEGLDFFAPNLSTHPTPIQNATCQNTAQRKLSEANRFPFSVGTTDFALYDQSGADSLEFAFPFEVILVATNQMKRASRRWVLNRRSDNAFGAAYFEEMADELLTLPLTTNRRGVANNTLWNVMARSAPGADSVKIGEIELTDSFQVSRWADESLFFKHEGFNASLSFLERAERRVWNEAVFENTLPIWGTATEDLPADRAAAQEVI